MAMVSVSAATARDSKRGKQIFCRLPESPKNARTPLSIYPFFPARGVNINASPLTAGLASHSSARLGGLPARDLLPGAGRLRSPQSQPA